MRSERLTNIEDAMNPPDGSTKTVSVLIVDDQHPFRDVARTVIAMTDGFTVTGEAATGEEAVALAEAQHPELVLMDINLPGINGIEATRRIKSALPATVVILLSTYSEGDLPADARSCGAVEYVHKEDFGPSLVQELWARSRM
jgi:two-component system, NarL family, invasion response regulator UvrY